MNIRELLFVVLISLVTAFGIEYLFLSKSKTASPDSPAQSGQRFVAPQTKQELKPLAIEMDFIDTRQVAPSTKTTIETPQAQLVFSSDGAILEQFSFKRMIDGKLQMLTTINPSLESERESGAFLVALQEKTPYFYTLVSQESKENTDELLYTADYSDGTISKKFIVYKNSFKIDLIVTLQPKSDKPVEARIFYPAPTMPTIMATDVISAIMNNEKGGINKIASSSLDMHVGWFMPTLFGVDNRYFVHAMVTDPAHFAQRGYYKKTGDGKLFAVLEGPVVTKEQSWTISFYVGPKESQAVSAVDPRLEDTLEFAGWFAPLSRLFLKILNFLYGYLYNYGLAIIALTILIKLLMLPLTLKSAQSVKKSSELQRKMQYLKQRYKHDQEAYAREQEELIRKNGMPWLGGCLPMLLQIPIFFALRNVLYGAIELYQAPFGLWIQDLSEPDPYYVLPLLMVVAMLAQAMVSDSKQRLQFVLFSFIIGAVMVNVSAGITLYFVISTGLGVMQQTIQEKLKV